MGRGTQSRPLPPEPEIIYTAEENSSAGMSTRLVIVAVLGLIVVGGIFLAFSGGEKGAVAPVSPNLVSEAPAPSNTMTPPAAPQNAPEEMSPAEHLRSLANGDLENSSEAAPTASTTPPATGETEPQPEATPPAPVAPAAAPEAVAPMETAKPVESAKPATPAKMVTPQAGGAYVVQLLALRDEGAARAAWKKLSSQHKTVLGSHALDIEKADLGSKGVWYRVRAAGFASKSAATRACASLKSANQSCIVKKR